MKLLRKNTADRLRHEFLPAAEEIVESPPSPFGRIVLWITTALLFVTLLWLYFGKIDVIASAQGKVVPEGNIKIVQPAGQALIKDIKVTEGQRVKKGQTLIEFDSTIALATVQSLEKSLEIAKLERDVLKSVEAGQDAAALIGQSTVSEGMKNDLLLLTQSQRSGVDARRELLGSSVAQAQAQVNTEKQNLQALESNLRDAQAKQALIELSLPQAAGAARTQLETELRNAIAQIASTQSAIGTQKQRIAQVEASVQQANGELRNYNIETSSTNLSTVIEHDKKINEFEDSLIKAKKELELQTLLSPVDGVVITVAASTIGGVTTAAQPLVTIVPDKTKYLIEADVSPTDIGFVKEGQKVTVKVDTFSFQRYGYLTGTVKTISADAVNDEKKGPVYKVKVSLDEGKTSKNNTIEVIPGMTVTGELVTGQRRIVEFFLDPLITHVGESLKVR